MLSDLQFLQHPPTLKAMAMTLHMWWIDLHPHQLAFFLPSGRLSCNQHVASLMIRFDSAELSYCLPSREVLPRNITALTQERKHSTCTDLALLSACPRSCTLTIFVQGNKLALCGMRAVAPSLSLIELRRDSIHQPAHLFHGPTPGWELQAGQAKHARHP